MRKFIIKISFYFVPFICCVGIYLIIQSYITGGVGELGQIPFGKEYDKRLEQNYLTENYIQDTLINTIHHLIFNNKSTILTIGDSYSQSGERNFRYNNYLSYLFHYSVVNIEREENTHDPVQDAISLLNSGIIDSTTCKVVIVETADRHAIWRLSAIDFEHNYSSFKKKESQKKKTTMPTLLQLCSFIRLQFGYDNPIQKCPLIKECFNHFWGNTAFCYKNDLNLLNDTQKIEKAKQNLTLLNKRFSEKGIKLIFLICADTYDVYRPFMKDETLPVDTTTDGLDKLPEVCVINSKYILQKMVQNGEKDVYRINDTHWSYKASEVVAKKIAHDIDSLRILK